MGMTVAYTHTTDVVPHDCFLVVKGFKVDWISATGELYVKIYASEAAMQAYKQPLAETTIAIHANRTDCEPETQILTQIKYADIRGTTNENAETHLKLYSIRIGGQVLDLTQAT